MAVDNTITELTLIALYACLLFIVSSLLYVQEKWSAPLWLIWYGRIVLLGAWFAMVYEIAFIVAGGR